METLPYNPVQGPLPAVYDQQDCSCFLTTVDGAATPKKPLGNPGRKKVVIRPMRYSFEIENTKSI